MTGSSIDQQLQQAQNLSSNPQQLAGEYHRILRNIIKAAPSDQANELVAYVQAILSESIGVIHSRPLLSSFVEAFRSLEDQDVIFDAGPQILQLLAPRTVSYEQQDTDLRYFLADNYESCNDYANSAQILQRVTLDSSQRAVSDDDKAKVWMRICRCYLEDDDATNAATYLNRVKQVIYNVTDQVTRLQFQLSQARISDSQRAFLDASTAYHALSVEAAIDEDERLQTLSAAITCAVLAPAGPQRARQLGKLYKDDRATSTPEHGILEKIFLDRLLAPAEVAAFAAGLREHQLAKTADGSSVLDKAVLEHNLLAVSRLYRNIALASLGALLGVDARRAEAYAAAMIESQRLSGSIDQIDGVIHFNTSEGGSDAAMMNLRAWDANVQGLAEEVEKVATMLQKEEPVWYEAHVSA